MQNDTRNIYKRARRNAGYTQEAAAEMLNVSVESLRAYETDRRIPAGDVVLQMMICYNCHQLPTQHLQEKRILPKATKSSMVKLIRSKGHDVPSIYQAIFSRHGHAFWLRWVDKKKVPHSAYYSGAGGRPVLQVDKTWIDLTMAEVIQFGLYEEK